MKRPQQEKQQAHQRIVAKAGEQIRAEGVNSIGTAELMGLAGLTHGGFYAHFENKDALLAEICQVGMAETLATLCRAIESAPEGMEVEVMVGNYLSLFHRDHPALGCVMPAISADIARRPGEVRSAFTQGYEGFLQTLAPLMPGESVEQQRDAMLVLLSGMVGSLMLSRTINDPVLSERLLQVNQEFYSQTFSQRSPQLQNS